jgi:site-specific DNA-methyltransferase (adenine-specific)
MLKPYYEDELTTIYHGDCREILPQLEPVALLLADPPYGIGYVHSGGGKSAYQTQFAGVKVIGDDEPFDPTHLLAAGAKKMILWGANNYSALLPRSNGWLIWDKREDGPSNSMGDCELAWTNFLGACRKYSHLWNGFNKRSERGQRRVHPTQKPIALMKWCIALAGNPQSILDPYLGSGTTLRAAKDLAIKSIGIEIDEKYCEIAVDRLRQGSLFSYLDDVGFDS